MESSSIQKTLTANDTGETGGHQAGICIPKDEKILSFFPKLNPNIKNPRCIIDVIDESDKEWVFHFIYYNSRFFGGTRNEYRLTGMTPYIKDYSLRAGDIVELQWLDKHTVRIKVIKKTKTTFDKKLKLSSFWKVI
jgi:hypothetical protein